ALAILEGSSLGPTAHPTAPDRSASSPPSDLSRLGGEAPDWRSGNAKAERAGSGREGHAFHAAGGRLPDSSPPLFGPARDPHRRPGGGPAPLRFRADRRLLRESE